MGIFVALVVGRVVTPKDAFACFGNEALITVAAMYVIAQGLIRTGAISFVGQRIVGFAHGSEVRVMFALMLAAAATSAFINNTPIVVIFLPIALSLAEASNSAPSKLLDAPVLRDHRRRHVHADRDLHQPAGVERAAALRDRGPGLLRASAAGADRHGHDHAVPADRGAQALALAAHDRLLERVGAGSWTT